MIRNPFIIAELCQPPLLTPWQATLQMLRTLPKPCSNGRIKFKTVTPEAVLDWLQKHRTVNTVEGVMEGMKLTRSTTKRIMGTLVDDGSLLVDKTAHARHFIYRLPE